MKQKFEEVAISESEKALLVIALQVFIRSLRNYENDICEEFSDSVYYDMYDGCKNLVTKLDK